ncbi:MerR family transcriptional regulator [Lacticaseibacillus saniviri]|uniref:MerR family transcriptional regulator n=1 Tax=Lacticaseibacillus saniviri JCM 17471 = DSM 24301 TaxID=1293598 RepID=A0A0R2MXX9_9LACO|nr:MerR family transcriptional regulator [Lacticaseibacillus saniviri]KRO18407.1 MerR family transcriptional regulator [Lacticaseibacillus saniviri JCM 17471 = DSM 24301]
MDNLAHRIKSLDISLGIGETSRVTGATATQIRYWEKKGLIEALRHESGGNKRYTLKNIAIISMIKMMMDDGYTLAKAGEIITQRYKNADALHTIMKTRLEKIDYDAESTEYKFGQIENDPDFDITVRVTGDTVKIYKVEHQADDQQE